MLEGPITDQTSPLLLNGFDISIRLELEGGLHEPLLSVPAKTLSTRLVSFSSMFYMTVYAVVELRTFLAGPSHACSAKNNPLAFLLSLVLSVLSHSGLNEQDP